MTDTIKTISEATSEAGPFAPHPGATPRGTGSESPRESEDFPHSATYSPEDNKLRLYPANGQRLNAADYERVKAAGFSWAPRQGCFVAGMWTPGREDLLLDMAGSIEPEEMTLAERQAERAARFSGYRERRTDDAHQATAAAREIGRRFEFGQPILVGHHSERRARKDQERMQSAMRAAVNAWETAAYWRSRAAGALAHADYKDRPDVRARRIKTIEADLRKAVKETDEARATWAEWQKPGLTLDRAKALSTALRYSWKFPLDKYPRDLPASQYEGSMGLWSAIDGGVITDPLVALDLVERACQRSIDARTRWISHYENRLSYERTMLGAQIGVSDVSARWPLAIGGRILTRGSWVSVLKINKKDGKIVSVSTNARYGRIVGIEMIEAYEAPTEDAAQAAAGATARGKVCNYPDETTVTITRQQWDAIPKDYRGQRKIPATDAHQAHQRRIALGVWLPIPDITDSLKLTGWKHRYHFVFISDGKRVDAPAAEVPPAKVPAPEKDATRLAQHADAVAAERLEGNQVDEIKQGLESAKALAASMPAVVPVFDAVDLFPTPAALAERMCELAEVQPGEKFLEPETGPGAIAAALLAAGAEVQGVEISESLTAYANTRFAGAAFNCLCADFLKTTPAQLGLFQGVVMNPPFGGAADIQHVMHALTFLEPGRVLVAIVGGGPRQAAALQPMAELWERLPSGTFEDTSVHTVLCKIRA